MVTRKTFAQQSNDFISVHESIEPDVNNMDFGNILNGSIDNLGCISCDSLAGHCDELDLLPLYPSTSDDSMNNDLCDDFNKHYEFLMDEGLIESCQLTSTQQSNQLLNETVISGTISFSEFSHQFNELVKWLNKMHSISLNTNVSSCCEKYANQIFYEEILKRSPRRKLLIEYARHLVKYHPHLKNNVLIKLHYLNKHWKSMEFSMFCKRYHDTNIIRDLEADLDNFENWLDSKELFMDSLMIDSDWNEFEIADQMKLHKHNVELCGAATSNGPKNLIESDQTDEMTQSTKFPMLQRQKFQFDCFEFIIQKDIESHSKIINSVLKLSTKLKQICTDCFHYYDKVSILQNRWHCLWLNSLEWQCRLEQLHQIPKKSIRVHEKAIYDDSTHTLVNDDIIPFDDCEYEKLSQTSLNDSEMSNTEENNHRLDSYYSLTNIDYYNIDDDDDYDGDSCTQKKVYHTNDNASLADAKKDIGYSTDNENESGSLLTAKNLARQNRKQKLFNNKNIKQKSLSDNYINTSRRTANRMRHYKNFFSRYSRLIDSDNDDDYDDYIDDRAESVNSKCNKQYGSQNFGIKQSSTTSGAYDTSSNLSADYNQINCFFLDSIASNSEDKKVYDVLDKPVDKQITNAIDEISTTNTEMSDPHWDGYINSTYYGKNPDSSEIKTFQPQPILPWDDVFFELESNEDDLSNSQFSDTNTHASRKNHYRTSLKRNFSNSKNNNKSKKSNKYQNHSDFIETDDSEMEELSNIINESVEQWYQACTTYHDNLTINSLHVYNEVLATCQTNINCLSSIKVSLDKNQKMKSVQNSPKLNDIIQKWKNLEPLLLNKKNSYTKLLQMLNDVKQIEGSLDFVSNLCKYKKFKTMNNLQMRIEQLEQKEMNLIEHLSDLNEFKENMIELYNDGIDTSNVKKKFNSIGSLHKKISTSCKIFIQKLKNIQNYWIKLDQLFKEIETSLNDCKRRFHEDYHLGQLEYPTNLYRRKANLKSIENQIKSCDNELNNLKENFDIITFENYLLRLDKHKLEFNGLCQINFKHEHKTNNFNINQTTKQYSNEIIINNYKIQNRKANSYSTMSSSPSSSSSSTSTSSGNAGAGATNVQKTKEQHTSQLENVTKCDNPLCMNFANTNSRYHKSDLDINFDFPCDAKAVDFLMKTSTPRNPYDKRETYDKSVGTADNRCSQSSSTNLDQNDIKSNQVKICEENESIAKPFVHCSQDSGIGVFENTQSEITNSFMKDDSFDHGPMNEYTAAVTRLNMDAHTCTNDLRKRSHSKGLVKFACALPNDTNTDNSMLVRKPIVSTCTHLIKLFFTILFYIFLILFLSSTLIFVLSGACCDFQYKTILNFYIEKRRYEGPTPF